MREEPRCSCADCSSSGFPPVGRPEAPGQQVGPRVTNSWLDVAPSRAPGGRENARYGSLRRTFSQSAPRLPPGRFWGRAKRAWQLRAPPARCPPERASASKGPCEPRREAGCALTSRGPNRLGNLIRSGSARRSSCAGKPVRDRAPLAPPAV